MKLSNIIRIACGLALSLLIVNTHSVYENQYPYFNQIEMRVSLYKTYGRYEIERNELIAFSKEWFEKRNGYRTNIIELPQRNMASGADVLSESVGFQMLIAIRDNDKNQFNRLNEFIKEKMMNQNGLIKWRVREGVYQETVNASIDDFRIVKALIKAYEKWQVEEYLKFANQLGDKMLEWNIKDLKLLSFDLIDSKEAPHSYYDFEAMYMLSEYNKAWRDIVEFNLKIFLKEHERNIYYSLEDQGNYETIENLIVILHLAQIGVDVSEKLKWYKIQLNIGVINASYNKNLKAMDTIESAAIYGLLAIISNEVSDQNLYDLSAMKIINMQNGSRDRYNGGFVNLENLEAFSFDQLTCILGL